MGVSLSLEDTMGRWPMAVHVEDDQSGSYHSDPWPVERRGLGRHPLMDERSGAGRPCGNSSAHAHKWPLTQLSVRRYPLTNQSCPTAQGHKGA
jgi:hypothetical protein